MVKSENTSMGKSYKEMTNGTVSENATGMPINKIDSTIYHNVTMGKLNKQISHIKETSKLARLQSYKNAYRFNSEARPSIKYPNRKFEVFNDILTRIDQLENRNQINEFEINNKLESYYDGDKSQENMELISETDILVKKAGVSKKFVQKSQNVVPVSIPGSSSSIPGSSSSIPGSSSSIPGSKRRIISKPVDDSFNDEEIVDVIRQKAVHEDDDIKGVSPVKKDQTLTYTRDRKEHLLKSGNSILLNSKKQRQNITLVSLNQTFNSPSEPDEELQRLNDALSKTPSDPFDFGNVGYFQEPMLLTPNQEEKKDSKKISVSLSRKTKVPFYLKNKTEIFQVTVQGKNDSLSEVDEENFSDTAFNLKKYENLTKSKKHPKVKISKNQKAEQRNLQTRSKNDGHYIMNMKTRNTKNNKTYFVPSSLKFGSNDSNIIATSQTNGSDLILNFGNAKLKLFPEKTNISLTAKETNYAFNSTPHNPLPLPVLMPEQHYSPYLRPQDIDMYKYPSTTMAPFYNQTYKQNIEIKSLKNSSKFKETPKRYFGNISSEALQKNISLTNVSNTGSQLNPVIHPETGTVIPEQTNATTDKFSNPSRNISIMDQDIIKSNYNVTDLQTDKTEVQSITEKINNDSIENTENHSSENLSPYKQQYNNSISQTTSKLLPGEDMKPVANTSTYLQNMTAILDSLVPPSPNITEASLKPGNNVGASLKPGNNVGASLLYQNDTAPSALSQNNIESFPPTQKILSGNNKSITLPPSKENEGKVVAKEKQLTETEGSSIKNQTSPSNKTSHLPKLHVPNHSHIAIKTSAVIETSKTKKRTQNGELRSNPMTLSGGKHLKMLGFEESKSKHLKKGRARNKSPNGLFWIEGPTLLRNSQKNRYLAWKNVSLVLQDEARKQKEAFVKVMEHDLAGVIEPTTNHLVSKNHAESSRKAGKMKHKRKLHASKRREYPKKRHHRRDNDGADEYPTEDNIDYDSNVSPTPTSDKYNDKNDDELDENNDLANSIAGFGVNDDRFGETWFEGQEKQQKVQKGRKPKEYLQPKKLKSKKTSMKESYTDLLHGFERDDNPDTKRIKAMKKLKKKLSSEAETQTEYNEGEDLKKDIEAKTANLLKKICHEADCQNAVVTSGPENDPPEDESQLSNYVKGGDEIIAQVSVGKDSKPEDTSTVSKPPSTTTRKQDDPNKLDSLPANQNLETLLVGDFVKKSKPEVTNSTFNMTDEEKYKTLREKLAKIRAEAEKEVGGDRKQILKDKCDCDSFVKVIKTPGCMEYCKSLIDDNPPSQSSSVIITDGDSPSSPGKIYGGDIVSSSTSLPKVSTSTQVNKIPTNIIHTSLAQEENDKILSTDPLFQQEKHKINTGVVSPADIKMLQIDKKIIDDLRNEAAHDPGIDLIFKERLKKFADTITKKNIDEILREPVSAALQSYYKTSRGINRCPDNCPDAPGCPLDCPLKRCPIGCPGAANCPDYCPTIDANHINIKDHVTEILNSLTPKTPLIQTSPNENINDVITSDIKAIDKFGSIQGILGKLSTSNQIIPNVENHEPAKLDINTLNDVLHRSGPVIIDDDNQGCRNCDEKSCNGCHDDDDTSDDNDDTGTSENDVISKEAFQRLLHTEKGKSHHRMFFKEHNDHLQDDDDDDGNDVYYDDEDSDEQRMFHEKKNNEEVRSEKSGHHFYEPYPVQSKETGDEDWSSRYSNKSTMCQNGGVFIPLSDSSKTRCICTHQFYGDKCQNYNYCYPNPCENGGQCLLTTEVPMYKCACSKAYVGPKCEDLNPCDPSPCNNQGVCSHDGKIATCSCNSRFKGENCQELNRCYPNPCKNSGTCIANDDGKFRCECKHGYKGKTCEDESACASSPCLNGAKCYENGTSFSCQCGKGFVGKTCKDKVCSPNPCNHGGTCVQRDNSAFVCICPPWSNGDTCEEISPCRMNPCKNNARCIDSASGFRWTLKAMQYFCDCIPPYKGAHCERNACANCDRNAKCNINRCECNHGFYGNGIICRKSNKTHACSPNPCKNNGKCIKKHDGTFKCLCKKPYLPPLCKGEDICQNYTCGNNGKCFTVGTEAHCKCNKGYSGKFCTYINRCQLDENACSNNGICIADGNNTFSCECPGKWTGKQCQDCGCAKSDNETIPSSYCKTTDSYCHCPPGYRFSEMNQQCQHTKEYLSLFGEACKSKPCANGGFCIELDGLHGASYKCSCRKETYGKNCEFKKQCNPNPCANGGACLEKDGKFLGCECPIGYRTTLCKTKELLELPSCHPSPCLHGAVCLPHPLGGYDCICPPRYTGPHCQIDRCRDCDTQAECVEGRCVCKEGYIGTGYECIQRGCNGQCLHFQTCLENKCQCIPGHKKVFDICIPITLDADGDDDDPLKLNLDKKKKVSPTTTSIRATTISHLFSTTYAVSTSEPSKNMKTTAWPPTDFSSTFPVHSTEPSVKITTSKPITTTTKRSTTSTSTSTTSTTEVKVLKKKSPMLHAPTNPSPTNSKGRVKIKQKTQKQLNITKTAKDHNENYDKHPSDESLLANLSSVELMNKLLVKNLTSGLNNNTIGNNTSNFNLTLTNSSMNANITTNKTDTRHKLTEYQNHKKKTESHKYKQIEIEHLPDAVKNKLENNIEVDPIKVHVEKQTNDDISIENILEDNQEVESFDDEYKNMTVFNEKLPFLIDNIRINQSSSQMMTHSNDTSKIQDENKSHNATENTMLLKNNSNEKEISLENNSKVHMIYKFLRSYSNINISKILNKVAKDLNLQWTDEKKNPMTTKASDMYPVTQMKGILKHFIKPGSDEKEAVIEKYPIEFGVRGTSRNQVNEVYMKRLLSLLKHRAKGYKPTSSNIEQIEKGPHNDMVDNDVVFRPRYVSTEKHHGYRTRALAKLKRLERPYQFLTRINLKTFKSNRHSRHQLRHRKRLMQRKLRKNNFEELYLQ